MSKKDKSTFSHFFKEDAEVIQDILIGRTDQQPSKTFEIGKKDELPKIVSAPKANEDEFNRFWLKLRSFIRTANNSVQLPEDLSPVLMAPLYNQAIVGSDFPFWVADTFTADKDQFCLPLNEILTRALNEIAPGENDATILKNSVARILHIANDQFNDAKPRLFVPAISQILDTLKSELDVTGAEGQVFQSDLGNLFNALPSDGVLIPYSINTSFQILEAATAASLAQPRANLVAALEELKSKLKDLLRIEEDKNPDIKNKEGKRVTLDFADSIVNFDQISTMAPDSGTVSLGEDRLERINKVVNDLEVAHQILNQQAFFFTDETLRDNTLIDWENLFENAAIETFTKGRGVDTIAACFNLNIAEWTRLFVAKRIGELELNNGYFPEIHDDYFQHFDWSNFSSEELNSCPHFILISDENELFENELGRLSSVLSDNIPVKIVSVKADQPAERNALVSRTEGFGLHARAGIEALMISHKNIFVAQSTSITPQYLFNAFLEGVCAFAPAFFSILHVQDKINTNSYLRASAAIESRDFPGFTYRGLLGTPWGSRFEVQNNPQPQVHWPVHALTVVNAEGEHVEMEFAFTYAHQAVLNSAYHQYFMQVDASYWDDNLIPLLDYNKNSVEENIGKIPFIWMLDGQNELCKVAVSWPVILATQERLDFWGFLQENSGINNYHVRQAVEQVQSEMKKLHSLEIENLQAAHAAEIETVRVEEAGIVMENLTSVLLDLDTTQFAVTSKRTASPAPAASPAPVAEKSVADEKPVAEEDDSMLSTEPYIDTPLCTSCNECTDLNGRMFNYNKDKMAFVADPTAGTFLELVKAAELCPVGIIHPGTPVDPSEPDLDGLVLRAAKFN